MFFYLFIPLLMTHERKKRTISQFSQQRILKNTLVNSKISMEDNRTKNHTLLLIGYYNEPIKKLQFP